MTVRLRPLLLAAAAALGLGLAQGCTQREGTPEEAYRAFAKAAASGDADQAWALLSKDTQAWLDARAREAVAQAPGVVPASGRQLLLGAAARTARPIAQVIVRRESRDRALLEVTEQGGQPREVELVREQGWKVRLPPPEAARTR